MSGLIQSFLVGEAEQYGEDTANDYAQEKFQKDPFYVEVNGEKRKRKAPEGCTKSEEKIWKKIMRKAWHHDRNLFGIYSWNLGLGVAPIIALCPVIGPLLLYGLHNRVVQACEDELHIPKSLQAKMAANILVDFLITLVPAVGAFFTWLYSSSSRNAALMDTWLKKDIARRNQQVQMSSRQVPAEFAPPPPPAARGTVVGAGPGGTRAGAPAAHGSGRHAGRGAPHQPQPPQRSRGEPQPSTFRPPPPQGFNPPPRTR